MNIKMKAVAAAVAMVAAGGAQAAINPGANGNNGELFVSVYDAADNVSYTRDLGVTVAQFLASPSTPLSFTHDSRYTSTFGSVDSSTLVYNVVGMQDSDFSNPADYAKWGVLVTSAAGSAAMSVNGFNNAAAAIGNGSQYVGAVNGNAVAQNSGATLTNYSQNLSSTATGGLGYYAGGSFGSDFAGSLLTSDQAAVGQSMAFYHLGMALDSNGDPVLDNDQNIVGAVSSFAGTWNVAANGDVTYSVAAPVPLPPAVWLLGSALAGLVGVARRKNQDENAGLAA